MSEITMKPTSVSQPNRNKSSGLQGTCFKAVRRSGTTYNVNCRDQKDPKYHHEWSNAEEILKGKTIQCGRPSTKHCSHKTYYGIAGYRNTCPIAGVTGTYTQPATLRLLFDLSKKGINSKAKINKVVITFEHRCTGVDVSNGKETTNWGPNFSGGDVYPHHKALTVKIGNKTKTSNKNPPLSKKFSKTDKFIFEDVSYKDLTKNGVDIIYGNNLETNPGNIYIKNLEAVITYNDQEMYIEGTQDKNTLSLSDSDGCRIPIIFTLEAGYKHGNTKIAPKNAPKKLNKEIVCESEDSEKIIATYEYKSDGKTTIATLYDKTNITGEKKVTFKIKGTKKKVTFKYNAVIRQKPDIEMINIIQRNVKNPGVQSIIVNNGCCTNIKVYDNKIHSSTLFYEFTNFNLNNYRNIIRQEDNDSFYEALAGLSCGDHTIYFVRNDEPDKEAIGLPLSVRPTVHTFEFYDSTGNTKIASPYDLIQNKSANDKIKIKYLKNKNLINPPKFNIINPTHGKLNNNKPTKDIIDDIVWNTSNNNTDMNNLIQEITIGQYYPGEYILDIQEVECPASSEKFTVNISPRHRQYFDEIFVEGVDSTAFSYDYLVALEGDTITKPIYVNNINVGASYEDIKICSSQNNIGGLGKTNTFNITITNTSSNDIENLLLELNTLIKDDDDNLQVTSNEWLESDGIFYNFKENFETFNNNCTEYVSIKNLTADDDSVDEEDVYIHITNLLAQQSITLKIPYNCNREKEVFLQILLFGNAMKIYDEKNCSDESKTTNLIPVRVYDSILTEMFIEGETDLFNTEIINQCPNECFKTKLKYSIRNIDTKTLSKPSKICIENDPKLVPYKCLNKNNIEIPLNDILIAKEDFKEPCSLKNEKINLFTKFEGYEEKHSYMYTDSNGEIIFFVKIPKTIGGEYTLKQVLKFISIEYEGNYYFNSKVKQEYNENTSTIEYLGGIRNYLPYNDKKNNVDIIVTNENSPLIYTAGQTVPIRIQVTYQERYLRNDIIYDMNIQKPQSLDSITIFYKICNLKNNEGKIKTLFRTNDDIQLIPNNISKTIYCGMNTEIELFTKIQKVILENRTLNRLYITLKNKKRDNKDIEVSIKEKNLIPKYDIIDYYFDDNTGTLNIEEDIIKWNISYMEEDSTIRGYIDFKAKEIGFSNLEVNVEDFLDKVNPPYSFGVDSYKCECRRLTE